MARSQCVASSSLPEKSSRSPAFNSLELAMGFLVTFMECSGVGAKDSSSSLVILVSGSGTGLGSWFRESGDRDG